MVPSRAKHHTYSDEVNAYRKTSIKIQADAMIVLSLHHEDSRSLHIYLVFLNLSCIMLKNGQTYFTNFAVFIL